MKAVLLKCPPYARFHFGMTGLDENSSLHQTSEVLHSDTLFAALMVLCNKIFPNTGKIERLKEGFETGAVKLSSAGYFLDIKEYLENGDETNKRVFFLPKPDYFGLINKDTSLRKKVKKIAFLSKGIWEKGLDLADWFDTDKCVIIQNRFVLLTEELHPDAVTAKKLAEAIAINKVQTAPKIADHLRRPENNIFFQTDLCFAANFFKNAKGHPQFEILPHFYFFLEHAPDSTIKKLVETLIEILPDEGIGGAISTGCGQLESHEIVDLDFTFDNAQSSDKYVVSASLISPKSADELSQILRYKVMTRGGRRLAFTDEQVAKLPVQKRQLKRVKLIKEGALIQKAGVLDGRLVPLHHEDNAPNYRNGKAFTLPIHPNFVKNEGDFS